MNNIDLMNYWIESSNEDYNVMNVLHNSKKIGMLFFFDNGHRRTIKGTLCKK